MNPYEMTFIVRPDRDEEETRAAVETVIGRVESTGGDVVATAPWNPPRRRMAYPIKEFSDGYYVTTVFRMDGQALRSFENGLKLNENVLRYLVVRATDLQVQQVQQRARQPQVAAQPPQEQTPVGEAANESMPDEASTPLPEAETAGGIGEEQDQESAVPIEAVAELEVDEPVAAATATESEE
ncbi:MAG TPA: 30S ribosomal protein S6 [Chloroflexi bacterium]|nr:30S ribosomal protein S6 [Chloroflexota bacterium]